MSSARAASTPKNRQKKRQLRSTGTSRNNKKLKHLCEDNDKPAELQLADNVDKKDDEPLLGWSPVRIIRIPET